jgi:hypothetical protein
MEALRSLAMQGSIRVCLRSGRSYRHALPKRVPWPRLRGHKCSAFPVSDMPTTSGGTAPKPHFAASRTHALKHCLEIGPISHPGRGTQHDQVTEHFHHSIPLWFGGARRRPCIPRTTCCGTGPIASPRKRFLQASPYSSIAKALQSPPSVPSRVNARRRDDQGRRKIAAIRPTDGASRMLHAAPRPSFRMRGPLPVLPRGRRTRSAHPRRRSAGRTLRKNDVPLARAPSSQVGFRQGSAFRGAQTAVVRSAKMQRSRLP